jgi:lysophospholipase L1-like esterase
MQKNIARRELFARSVLLALALLLTLLAGEVAVRLGYDALAGYDMEMWRYAREMKQPTGDAALPFVNRPATRGRYYGAEIRTNRLGCRGRELAADKGATRRVLMLGDSFTLGFGVPVESVCASVLEARLNAGAGRYEVINAGVGNYNSLMEEEWFRRYGLALQPDVVVVMFFVNDVEPTPRISGLRQAVARRSYLYALLADRFRRILAKSGRERYDWRRYYAGLYRPDAPAVPANRAALGRIAAACRQRGIPLLVASIPDLHQLRPYPFPMATAYLEQFCADAGVRCIDLLPHLEAHEPERLWVSREDTHANALANGIFAGAIHDELCAMGAVACDRR